MWPFKKRRIDPPIGYIDPQELSYIQVDITEGFHDNLPLGPDDWLATTPLNGFAGGHQSSSRLPRVGASQEETYRIAEQLSRIRERLVLRDDGVYCPICHIANLQVARLRTPCPKCGRPLLKFGWT